MSSTGIYTYAIGAVGGVLLSICTIPQLYRMWKTKSADDVSMSFLVTYSVGIALTACYLVILEAWAGAGSIMLSFLSQQGPAILELAMAFALIFSKLYIDRYFTPLRRISREETQERRKSDAIVKMNQRMSIELSGKSQIAKQQTIPEMIEVQENKDFVVKINAF